MKMKIVWSVLLIIVASTLLSLTDALLPVLTNSIVVGQLENSNSAYVLSSTIGNGTKAGLVVKFLISIITILITFKIWGRVLMSKKSIVNNEVKNEK